MSFIKKNISVTKSVRDYALFCTFKHALRRHPVFASGRAGLVLLNVPEGYSPKDYGNAVVAELYPDDNFRRADAGFMYIGVKDKPDKAKGDYEDDCQNKKRAVIIVEHGASVPQEVILGADVIVDILPINFRDVRAACHVVLGMKLSEEEAKRILEFPLDQVWAALRRGRLVSEVMRRLSEVVVQQDLPAPKKPERAVPPLSEMHGYGDAKEWGISLARDISDWRNGHIAWDDIDKGVVLSGPPGVGKSIYAKAVAKECEVSLIATSLGQWQSRGHLGDLLRAMRADFAAAKAAAPAILFIDEIDSIGNREKFTHDHKDYSVQVVNAFLECLDGLDSREGVVVVGATNNITRIDPAVLRAGRLDQHIEIPLPDGASRVAILSQHIDGIITIEGLQPLRAATIGMTGADLAKVARDARRLARREKRALTVDDLRAALPEVIKIEGDYRRSIAVHEAGHTVVGNELKHGAYLGNQIVDQVVMNGADQKGGAAYFDVPTVSRRDRDYYLSQIAIMLAGLAAEDVVLGSTGDGAGAGPNSDLALATRLATLLETKFGMGASFRHSSATSDAELEKLRVNDRELAFRVDCKLAAQFIRAKEILEGNRPLLDAVADALVENGSITPKQYDELVQQHQMLQVARVGGINAVKTDVYEVEKSLSQDDLSGAA
ncbi:MULTISPECIES: AAA family ATPase [unclassified Shinella]|uniref:AAA family ATPase n=1 Tax=unclassified Shinella TaxID=2643062 RepID=UPI00225CC6A3|nr:MULTISPECIES: AAA family ATPase [unclassified Shinella]MCO5138884.1 AAA family ATPase [Shinella sp.]MDC7255723.1 AAA family ATPase [Shinella sp. YE25]CAI0338540.1 Cell division protein FtsH [Rhizobiaceae bacterium]CAK7256982.1 AAA family ATPase [Shinella sp. WSC3-e]